MPARRANLRRIKRLRSYSVTELADCCGVHPNTVRHWQTAGLEPIDARRPVLFRGETARAFLIKRKASRKRPCPPGTLYCFKCRAPRPPALGMVDYLPHRPASGNLRALCVHCEAIMHRSVRKSEIAKIMPKCTVQITEGQPSLSGRTRPSLNCESERHG
jgi:hypothetical protein